MNQSLVLSLATELTLLAPASRSLARNYGAVRCIKLLCKALASLHQEAYMQSYGSIKIIREDINAMLKSDMWIQHAVRALKSAALRALC